MRRRRKGSFALGYTGWKFYTGSLSDTTKAYTFSLTRGDPATHVGTDGYLKEVAANVARFESSPGGGAALGLLHEDLQTNLYTYSSNVATTGWTYSNGASDGGTDATVTGMDGNDARKINVGQSNSVIIQTVTTVATTKYCCSYYVRYGLLASFKRITLWNTTDAINVAFAWDGDSWDFSASSGSPDSYGAEEHVDGWWRVWIVTTAGGTSTQFRLQFEGGSSGEYMHVGCVQCEAVPYADSPPTSWIPTTSASEDRAKDVYTIASQNFSLDESAGVTVYAECRQDLGDSDISAAAVVDFYASATGTRIFMRSGTTDVGTLRGGLPISGSTTYISAVPSPLVHQDMSKWVLTGISGDSSFHVAGQQIGVGTPAVVDINVSLVTLGDSNTGGSTCYRLIIRELRLYDEHKSDAEALALST